MTRASLTRVRVLLTKDLKLGPRSPLVLWALIIPVALTLLVRGVFGGLFGTEPRLGIVDQGASDLVAAAVALDGIEVTLLDDPVELRERVGRNDLDAGLILQPGFDRAVRGGERPELDLFVGGESLASTRIIVAVTALDLIRGIEGDNAPVEVELVIVGDEPLPLELTVLPLFVIMAVALAGVMIPAASLIEEKQAGTLAALLVTPSQISEVLGAKGLLGTILAVVAGTVTLAINGVIGASPVVMLTAVVLGAVMMAQVGLILGSWARDINTMFAAWKSGGLILFFPVIFFIWPDLPTWPARLGPTFYFLEPVHRASTEGATLGDVWLELAVAAVLCLALVPAVIGMGRRLEGRVGRRVGTSREEEMEPAA
jgi:ABC-2 type transport system permease protein